MDRSRDLVSRELSEAIELLMKRFQEVGLQSVQEPGLQQSLQGSFLGHNTGTWNSQMDSPSSSSPTAMTDGSEYGNLLEACLSRRSTFASVSTRPPLTLYIPVHHSAASTLAYEVVSSSPIFLEKGKITSGRNAIHAASRLLRHNDCDFSLPFMWLEKIMRQVLGQMALAIYHEDSPNARQLVAKTLCMRDGADVGPESAFTTRFEATRDVTVNMADGRVLAFKSGEYLGGAVASLLATLLEPTSVCAGALGYDTLLIRRQPTEEGLQYQAIDAAPGDGRVLFWNGADTPGVQEHRYLGAVTVS